MTIPPLFSILQVALIVLMAHVGSYVPADSCTMGIFDGIHVRRVEVPPQQWPGRSLLGKNLGGVSRPTDFGGENLPATPGDLT